MSRPLDITSLTVTRRTGAWSAGVWTPGSTSSFSLECSRPQPAGEDALQMLPEGARSSARYVIYAQDSEPELYTVGRDREGYAADTVAYDGEDYLVAGLTDWNGRPLGYRSYALLEYAPDEVTP